MGLKDSANVEPFFELHLDVQVSNLIIFGRYGAARRKRKHLKKKKKKKKNADARQHIRIKAH